MRKISVKLTTSPGIMRHASCIQVQVLFNRVLYGFSLSTKNVASIERNSFELSWMFFLESTFPCWVIQFRKVSFGDKNTSFVSIQGSPFTEHSQLLSFDGWFLHFFFFGHKTDHTLLARRNCGHWRPFSSHVPVHANLRQVFEKAQSFYRLFGGQRLKIRDHSLHHVSKLGLGQRRWERRVPFLKCFGHTTGADLLKLLRALTNLPTLICKAD